MLFTVSRLADTGAAANTARTMLRLLAGANLPLEIVKIWVEQDSVASTDHPLKLEVLYETTTAAPSGSTATPFDKNQVGGTSYATCLVNCTVEGAFTASHIEDHLIPATGGLYVYEWALGRTVIILPNKAIRLRMTQPTTQVPITYGIEWDE